MSSSQLIREEDVKLKFNEVQLSYMLAMYGLIFFFVSDIGTKFLYYQNFPFYRMSFVVRLFFEMLFFILIVLFLNKDRIVFLTLFAVSALFFFVGQISFSLKVDYGYNFLENISNFNKYFFIFIIYFAIYKVQYNELYFKKILALFERLVILNSVAAIIGFVFSIYWLRTYPQLYRNGYSGFFFAQNEASFFYFIVISYFYYKHNILNEKSWRFLIVLCSSLVLGTKAIYLFLAILLIFHFLSNSGVKAKFVALTIGIGIYFGGLWFAKTQSGEKVLAYFVSKTHQNGLFTMLLSNRNETVTTKGFEVLQSWDFLNYFVGGQDQNMFLIEMDFIDLFLFFGILGCAIIFILYSKTIFRFSFRIPFNLFFVFSFVLIAFFAGHFLSSAVCGLYLCLVCMYIFRTQMMWQK